MYKELQFVTKKIEEERKGNINKTIRQIYKIFIKYFKGIELLQFEQNYIYTQTHNTEYEYITDREKNKIQTKNTNIYYLNACS